MYNKDNSARPKTSAKKIEGLCYEPWGLPTERVVRLNAKYAQKEAENSSCREIIRHVITPAELLHAGKPHSQRKSIHSACHTDIYKYSRAKMVSEQLVGRGITDPNVLHAMSVVPRHLFVSEALQPTAYDDRPLPIACGQTISQPYTVALMCQLLMAERGMKVLEIGTGSGYQTAVLREMGLKVFSVERIRELYTNTKTLLNKKLGYFDLNLFLSDGTLGLEQYAPFDRIIVAAGGPNIPEALKSQMDEDGIMLIPVGREKMVQNLIRVFRHGTKYTEENHGPTTFVDLVGSQGW